MAVQSVFSAHEDRIQELETNQSKLFVDLTRLSVNLDHLDMAINERFIPTLKKIDIDLSFHRDESRVHREENAIQLMGIKSSLKDLEETRKAKLDRKALWQGRLTALGLGLLGTAIGALGSALWKYLMGA